MKDAAIYKKRNKAFVGIKKVVSKIKNMLASVLLIKANLVCSLHLDMNSFLHAGVFIHKKIKHSGVCK